MSDVAAGRRARGGGGSARRAERTAVSFETAKFIQRNIPNFEILNEEALQIIEHNAETVLEASRWLGSRVPRWLRRSTRAIRVRR